MTNYNPSQSSWRFTIRLNSVLSKINEDPSDSQDATAVDPIKGRFCISDGATQSFFSRLWAQELCNSFCNAATFVDSSNWLDWLERARFQWHQLVTERCTSLKLEKKISWIECSNGLSLKKPACATFLGLSIDNDYLKGITIGDSFAFLVKPEAQGNDFRVSPLFSIERIIPGIWNPIFSNRTEGLSSYPTDAEHKPEFFEIPVLPNRDASVWILMMSDALASYTIQAEQQGLSILSDLVRLTSPAEFERLVGKLRVNGMANDDTSLLCIQVERDLRLTIIETLSVIDDPDATVNHLGDPSLHMLTDTSIADPEVPARNASKDEALSLKQEDMKLPIEFTAGEQQLDLSIINSADTQPNAEAEQSETASSPANTASHSSEIFMGSDIPLQLNDEAATAPYQADDNIPKSLSNSSPRPHGHGEYRASASLSLPSFLDKSGQNGDPNPFRSQLSKFSKLLKRLKADE